MFRYDIEEKELYYGEAMVDLTDNKACMGKYKGALLFYGIGSQFNVMFKKPKKKLPLSEALKRYKVGTQIDFKEDGVYFVQALGVELLESEVKAKAVNPYNYYLKLYMADINDPHKDATVFHIEIGSDQEDEEPQEDNFNL